MQDLIIEVRANELAPRRHNPSVPWLPGEIAKDAKECFEAGASIIHFHGRSKDGRADNRFETYRDTICAIRDESSILVHPTLGYTEAGDDPVQRISNILRLAGSPETKPDLAPIDMGSVNVDLYDSKNQKFRTNRNIYKNDTGTLNFFLDKLREVDVTPVPTLWNVSFTRQMEAFILSGTIQPPVFASLVMTEKILLAGHPCSHSGLVSHLNFLPKHVSVNWGACSIGANLVPLIDKIILMGGHVQIGLGDYPYVELGKPSNADLVNLVAQRSRELGRAVCTPDKASEILTRKTTPSNM